MTDLAQRYGTRRPLRRPLIITLVVFVAAASLGWLVWVIGFHGSPLVRSNIVSFHVNGQHSAVATLTVVRRTADVSASCLLRAQAEDHSIVGELNFTVDSAEQSTTTITRSIRTERKATSVQLLGCVSDGQTQRR